MAPPRALVVDWGGVLTEPLEPSLRAWAELDGIDLDSYRDVMASWLGDHQGDLATTNPIAALERGEIEVPHFEEQLAERLSTSWGNTYPREGWDEMFHTIVISGEVGMRKPDREIFEHTLDLLGVDAGEAVFVDDLPANVHAAVELGLIGVHHTSYDATAAELEAIFGIPLRS
jgi:HAD superfamily hydrolase (TIGR01509 family)